METESSTKPTVDTGTNLAFKRTLAAYDRTLLSWVRTAISLISFGFTIYKFFQVEKIAGESTGLIGAREFALILISIGLISLLLAVVGHLQNVRIIRLELPGADARRTYPELLAGLIGVLGVLALLSVILRQ
jgi:putative membrane protein